MRKTISATVATGAATSALFLGAGTAQADIYAQAERAPGGVAITVASATGGGPKMSGRCLLTSTVQGSSFGKPLPSINVPFFLPEQSPATVRLPGYPTGSTWNIKVSCPGPGGRTAQYTTVVW